MTRKHYTLITALCFCAIGPLATAQEVSTSEIYACADKADDAVRLACYDAAVGRFKAAEEAGEIKTITRNEVEAVQRDTFGLSLPSMPSFGLFGNRDNKDTKQQTKRQTVNSGFSEDGSLESITEAIDAFDRSIYDKLVIRLSNGQVWEQTDSRRVRIPKRQQPETATIRRASLGSFFMKLDNGTSFRVKRIK